MAEDEKEKGFVIKDRRRVSDTGEAREGDAAAEKQKEPDARPEAKPATEETRREEETPQGQAVPEINFASFIFSLGTSVMYHFGDFPDPVSKKAERNLEAAKQTIDIIAMLKGKTEGNLDPDEKGLIDGLLYELRMRYVKEREKG
jgi:hypothetical protein